MDVARLIDSIQCVQFCGTDRPSQPMSCVDGRYQCAGFTPVRLDECPDDTCGFPGASCCVPDGSTVPGTCPGGGPMMCPPGSFAPEASGCPDSCDSTHVPGGTTSIQFRIENESGAPLALWSGCQLSHAITSCVDAYTEPLPTYVFCSPACPSTDCVTCGGCDNSPAPISGSTAIGWNGTLAREEMPGPGGGCACTQWVDAPPGRCRIRVPVFDAEPPMIEGLGPAATVLYEVEADFTLPDEDGIVTVPIDVVPWIDACDGGACLMRLDPDTALAGCAPEADPGSECPASAPRRYRCERPVPLLEGCVDPNRRGQVRRAAARAGAAGRCGAQQRGQERRAAVRAGAG